MYSFGFLKRISPPIYVHVWGGLGSQLFACALRVDLERKFQNREVRMRFHSSGATERFIELDKDSDSKNRQILDYTKSGDGNVFLYRILKILMTQAGLLSSCDNDTSWNKLRPWVLIIRGHYAHRTILPATIEEVTLNEIGFSLSNQLPNGNTMVHYRIGDLATLSEKNYIEGARIVTHLKEKSKTKNFNVLVYSDSPEIAADELAKNDIYFKIVDMGPAQTIIDGFNSEYFIGTTAKISYWIVICREYFSDSFSALPLGHEKFVYRILGSPSQRINVF